jgi:hypothetical protein
MLLTVKDRLLLLGLFPQQGSIVNLRVIREARNELEFRPEEVEALELIEQAGNVRWNRDKDAAVDIQLSGPALGIAREAIRKLESEAKLTFDHIPLWEKLVDQTT